MRSKTHVQAKRELRWLRIWLRGVDIASWVLLTFISEYKNRAWLGSVNRLYCSIRNLRARGDLGAVRFPRVGRSTLRMCPIQSASTERRPPTASPRPWRAPVPGSIERPAISRDEARRG